MSSRRVFGAVESSTTALLNRPGAAAASADGHSINGSSSSSSRRSCCCSLTSNSGGAEPCCHRRHLLTMFGFWACFCMEVSRNFSIVVIPMAKEFGWDHATVGGIFASSYCECWYTLHARSYPCTHIISCAYIRLTQQDRIISGHLQMAMRRCRSQVGQSYIVAIGPHCRSLLV